MRYLTRRDLDRFKIFAAIKYVGKNVIELNYTKNSDLPDAIKATLNKDIIGKVNGVASLDGNGNVPLEQLGNIDTAIFVITDKLPTEDIKDNKIYIVPSTTTEENNIYTEYCYINNVWEKLGEFKAEVDLSEYAKKTEIPDTSNFVVMANDETPAKLYSGSKGTATISTTSGLNVSSMSGGVTLQPNTLNLASNDGFNFSANSTGIVFTIKGVGVRIGQNGSYTLTSPSSSGINTAHTQYTVPVVDGTFYDLTNKADTSSIPTKLSQLTNDANFITSYTETDPVWTSEKSNYYTKTEIDSDYCKKASMPIYRNSIEDDIVGISGLNVPGGAGTGNIFLISNKQILLKINGDTTANGWFHVYKNKYDDIPTFCLGEVECTPNDFAKLKTQLANITAATTAEEVVTKFNDLLTDLKAKGYMVADTAK